MQAARPEPSPVPEQPRLFREIGRVAGVEFEPTPVVLLALEGSVMRLEATTALVEQAISLRAGPVRAMYLAGPIQRLRAYVYGGEGGKLVRIAPSATMAGVRPDLAMEGALDDAAWATAEASDATDLKELLLSMPDVGDDVDFELPAGSTDAEDPWAG
jgi:hypothetical protein